MKDYIVTFFSHYDALTLFNHLKEKDIAAKLAPVPRKVSASCGTCLTFSSDSEPDFSCCEIEAVYVKMESGGGSWIRKD